MAVDYKVDGRIATITLNRPEAYNSIDIKTFQELHDALVAFRDNEEVWVGILTGAGEKSFCSGADITEMLPFLKANAHTSWEIPETPLRAMELYKPLIGAINGYALGGGLEIALICDIRIAAEHARFGCSEVNLGIMPGWGATQRLPRIIPRAKAAELILSGKPINAQEAYRIGLVNEVVPKTELMARAQKWAEDLAQVGPLAMRAAKEAMIRGYSMPLDEGLKLESALFSYLLGTEDFSEGRDAFLNKRKPQFKGK
ncbi:MAG: enoyl-CoA hydratase/isomerase family protein [Dehalococcoidales bacterium]